MHEVLVNRLGGLSLPRKSVVRLTDRPDMTLGVYRGRKTTMQQQQQQQLTSFLVFGGFVSCLGMPMTGSQTFPLQSINDFLTLKQCSADSDHQKGA